MKRFYSKGHQDQQRTDLKKPKPYLEHFMKKTNEEEFFCCFICGIRLKNNSDVVNLHLDSCLERQQRVKLARIPKTCVEDGMVSKQESCIRSKSYATRKLRNSDESISSDYWQCVVCQSQITNDNDIINLHLNSCLERMTARDSTHGEGIISSTSVNSNRNMIVKNEVPTSAIDPSSDDPISPTVNECSDAHDDNDGILNSGEIMLTLPPNFSLSAAVPGASSHRIGPVLLSTVPGLIIIRDFISEDEEMKLIASIDSDSTTPWARSSRSGICDSKAFGVRTQFGIPRTNTIVNNQASARGTAHKYSSEIRGIRMNDEENGEMGLPLYSDFVIKRFEEIKLGLLQVITEKIRGEAHYTTTKRAAHNISIPCLQKLKNSLVAFVPNECNMNSYLKHRGDYLKPHVDDRQLSGPILMNLSLCGKAIMRYSRFTNDGNPRPIPPPSTIPENEVDVGARKVFVDVTLDRRSLQLIAGEGRYHWDHEIRKDAILDPRRVSITWRGAGITGSTKSSLML